MDKDIAQSDPAEGSREVIERELQRRENAEVESPHEPEGERGENTQKRKPH